ncbi:hypothetical protein NDU88_002474 [Pleurodeles waltl]|uniref:Uncharacterized protein n=1 Tax=Pleurodeles waltl TaxID=8319 RepID=A0AAV7WLC1_PLEWA|nr:hypothetical protein NDU88_002474 [Pleurodeles waltl]
MAHQLLFSEALAHHKPGPLSRPTSLDAHAAAQPDPMMKRILQEITAVHKCLEGMDSKISELAAYSRSIREDITGFHDKLTGLDHHNTLVEDKLNAPSLVN